jgi:magnesium-transporting ATPase (P-type)
MALAFLLGLPLWALSLQRVIALHRSDETLLPSSVIPSTPLLTTPSQTHRSLEAEQSTASILRSYARHLLFIVSFFLVFVVSVVFRSIYYFSTLTYVVFSSTKFVFILKLIYLFIFIIIIFSSLSYTPMLLHTIAICGTGVFCFFIFGAPHMSACLQAWCPGSESALIDNQQRDVPVQYAIYSQIKSTSTP